MTSIHEDRVRGTHYAVLLAAFFGWLFDGFEMGLFPLVARPALSTMSTDPQLVEHFVGQWMGYITAMFLLGAAAGGWVFGWLGDKIGRVRAMALSILVYSLFTGLCYFAQAPWHLAVFRFLASLGMGGEWSLGVALVMESWPERYRPLMAGIIGAAANFGFFLIAFVAKAFPVTQESWRWMFLVGVAPALLGFIIRLFIPESEKWQASVKGVQTHPLREVFSRERIRHTLLGILFASVALIGTWGTVQWIPVWVDQLVGDELPGAKATVGMLSAIGAIIGCLIGPMLGKHYGRRPAYFILCLGSLLTCGFLYQGNLAYGLVFQATVLLVGGTTAAFYGWFPLFLPELFPTRMRATGQGVCFNTGRVFAAMGAIAGGKLVGFFDGNYASMGSVIMLIYVLGMVTIWLAPETRNRPLPE